MSIPGIALYVVGALVVLYIVAATWRSKDPGSRGRHVNRRDGRGLRAGDSSASVSSAETHDPTE
jgi:hypothetical protein